MLILPPHCKLVLWFFVHNRSFENYILIQLHNLRIPRCELNKNYNVLTHNWLYFTTCLYYPLKECWDGWLGTEKLKGWLTRYGKFEGMLTRHGKNHKDEGLLWTNQSQIGTKKWLTRYGKFEGMVDSARKNLKGVVDSVRKILRIFIFD